MQKDELFEKLNFNTGKKINVSKEIDVNYSNLIHWHPFVEILVSLRDNNAITINFNNYSFNTNDIAIIHPGDVHCFHDVSPNAFYVIQFPKDLITVMTEFNSMYSMFNQYHIIKYNPLDIECDKMLHSLKSLVHMYFNDSLFDEVRIYMMLLEFYISLGQYCLDSKKFDLADDDSIGYRATNLMVEACLYISQNCASALTLDDISHHLGISKSHFAHMFKKYTNMTFVDFLTLERIKKAENLISDPQIKMIDVAFASGFSSVSSFNRAFKKIKQISPREFRLTQIS